MRRFAGVAALLVLAALASAGSVCDLEVTGLSQVALFFWNDPLNAPPSTLRFELTPMQFDRRPVFEEARTKLWLFHSHSRSTGEGRWIIASHVSARAPALAYVHSWAMHPLHIGTVSPRARWQVWQGDGGRYAEASDASLACAGDGVEETVHVSAITPHPVNGFFTRMNMTTWDADAEVDRPVYGRGPRLQLYFKAGEQAWCVGPSMLEEERGVLACLPSTALLASELPGDADWTTASGGSLRLRVVRQGVHDANPFEALQRVRNERQQEHSSYVPSSTLSNGVAMPLIGLGTGAIMNVHEAVNWALEAGYRLLDTGEDYGNNVELGESLVAAERDLGIQRDQVWITTKVASSALGYKSTLESTAASLVSLNRSHLDMVMIHWPMCVTTQYTDCTLVERRHGTWEGTWHALEQRYAEGVVRAIGVSNWDVRLLDALLSMASVPPHAMQQLHNVVEREDDLFAACGEEKIQFQAYGSLRNLFSKDFRSNLMNAEERRLYDDAFVTVSAISRKYHRHPTAIILRWQLQKHIAVIPRATKREHIRANLEVGSGWELADEDVAKLDALGASDQAHWVGNKDEL